MEIVQAPASRGVEWLKQGWQLFEASPGPWLAMTVVYIVLYVFLQFLPGIASHAINLFAPALGGGMIFGASELRRGRPLKVSHLFQAFLDHSRTGPMLLLGLFNVAAGTIIGAIGEASVLGTIHGGITSLSTTDLPTIGTGMIVGILACLALAVLWAMALWFAVPLVMLDYATPTAAVRLSFDASSRNMWSLTVYGLCLAVLGVIAVIPLGLGLLVFIPLCTTSVYASVDEIFVRPATSSSRYEPA